MRRTLQISAVIAAQKQQLAAADARERARATALDQTLAQIQKLKLDTQTPDEVLSQLPQYLNLPQPITLNPPSGQNPPQAAATSDAGQGKNKKGTGLRLFGKNWFAPKTATASSDERASGSVASSPISEAVDPNVGSATAQTRASVDGKHSPASSSGIADAVAELPDAANPTQPPSDRTPSAMSQDAAT